MNIQTGKVYKGKTYKKFMYILYELRHDYKLITPYTRENNKVTLKHIKCGHTFSVYPNNFIKGRRCPYHFCSGTTNRNINLEGLRQKLHKFHRGRYELIGAYCNSSTKTKIRDIKCGHSFYITPSSLLSDEYKFNTPCPYCRHFLKLLVLNKKFRKRVHERFGIAYMVLSMFWSYEGKVKIRHNLCGCIWYTRPKSFLYKHRISPRCPRCGHRFRMKLQVIKGKEKFLKYLKYERDNKYRLISKYRNCFKWVLVKHIKCGHIMRIIPHDFIGAHQVCSKCYPTASIGELIVSQYLNFMNECYIYGYRIHNSKHKCHRLHLDFYLPSLRIGIEYDGCQHFRPIKYFGGKYKFKVQRYHDRNKNLFCRLLGIQLIRIEDYKDYGGNVNLIKNLVYSTLNRKLLPIIKAYRQSKKISAK